MNPYTELKKMMSSRRGPTSGTVVSVGDGSLQVRTVGGIITASTTDATNYKVGDDVLVESGVVKGRLRALSTVPVYQR